MKYFNKDSLDYTFLDKVEAGLVLTGADAKSLRTQGCLFAGSKVEIINGIPSIFNLNIPHYKFAHGQESDTTQERQLLLSRQQIAKLQSYRHQKYMLIPIVIYLKGKWFKVEIGVGRKMKKFEKRQKIKERDMLKEIQG